MQFQIIIKRPTLKTEENFVIAKLSQKCPYLSKYVKTPNLSLQTKVSNCQGARTVLGFFCQGDCEFVNPLKGIKIQQSNNQIYQFGNKMETIHDRIKTDISNNIFYDKQNVRKSYVDCAIYFLKDM